MKALKTKLLFILLTFLPFYSFVKACDYPVKATQYSPSARDGEFYCFVHPKFAHVYVPVGLHTETFHHSELGACYCGIACPQGLLFNVTDQRCDLPENIDPTWV